MKLKHWLGFLTIVIALYILWEIRQLLLLLFTAVVLATALNRLVCKLQKFRLKRGWAIALTVGALLTLFIVFFRIIVPLFFEQFQELIGLLPIGLEQLRIGFNWLEEQILGPYFPNIPDINGLIQQIQPLTAGIWERSLNWFSNSLSAVLETLLVLVIALMLLANPQPYRKSFIRCAPSFYRSRVDQILTRCEEGLVGWTTGALIEMVFIIVLTGIGLWILQVPLALAHAIIAGLLNFIPNIGPILSVFLPMAIAFLDAPWKVLGVLILYIVVQNVETYWLTPTVMAQQVALLPAVTLISQIFFTSFFGALGLLMALPLTVIAKTWIEEVVFKDILDQWNAG